MARGGFREGAGRKPAWNTGKTKAVKLPESLIPEIVEFAKVVDSTLVDGLYGRERVEEEDRLVDILFDEIDDSGVLERIAQKLLILGTNQERHRLDVTPKADVTIEGERGGGRLRISRLVEVSSDRYLPSPSPNPTPTPTSTSTSTSTLTSPSLTEEQL